MSMLILVVWVVAFICIQLLLVWGLQSKFLNSNDTAITMMKERPKWSKEMRTRYTRIPFNAQTLDSIFTSKYLEFYYPETLNIAGILDSLNIRPNDTLLFYREQEKDNFTFYISHTAVPTVAYQTTKFNIYFIYDETEKTSVEKDIYYNDYIIPIDTIIIDSVIYMPNRPKVFHLWDNSSFSNVGADDFLQLSIKDDTIRAITTLAKINNYEN